ncbi:zinc finger protein 160-like [Haliotis asinina]|uniref:zinc finger protein 160-like n=1 Tax=Haliotis asinina TaxID=109174 RepID=UPI003531FC5A
MVLMDPTPGCRSSMRTITDSCRRQELTQDTVCPGSLDTPRLQARSVDKENVRHSLDEAESIDVGTDSELPVVLLDGTTVPSMHKTRYRDAIFIFAADVNLSQETAAVDEDYGRCEGIPNDELMMQGRDVQAGQESEVVNVKDVGLRDPEMGENSLKETTVCEDHEKGCQGNLNNGLKRQGKDVQAGWESEAGEVVKDVGLKDPEGKNQTLSYRYDGSDHSLFDISLPSDGLPGRADGVRPKVVHTVTPVDVAGANSVGGASLSSDKLVVDEGSKRGEIVNNDTADSVELDSGVDRKIQLEGKVLQNHGNLVDCLQTVSADGSPSQLAIKFLRNSCVLKDIVDLKSTDQELIQNVSHSNHYQRKDTDDEVDEFTEGSNISGRNPSISQALHDDIASDLSMGSQDDNDDGVPEENSPAPCSVTANINANETGPESNCVSTKYEKRFHHISSHKTSQDCTKEYCVRNTESLKTGQGQDMTLCHHGDLGPEGEASSRKIVDDGVKVCDENACETDTFMAAVIKTEPDLPVNEVFCGMKDWSSFKRRRGKLKEEEMDSPLPAKRLKKNLKSHVREVRICSTRSRKIPPNSVSNSESCSCKVCEKYFSKEDKLNTHLKLHNQNGELQCATCCKTFTSVGRFKSHECKSSVYFECGICEKVFSERDKLKDHVDDHREIPEINFECGVCEQTFTEAISLNVHLQTHEGNKQFQCKLCEKTFTSSKCLESHKRKKHGVTYKCKICAKQFGKQISLDAHSKLHVKKQRFGCKKCGKRFSKLIDMRIHLKIHKRWKCRSCSESFETRTELMEHKVVHETMYECANCDFTCIAEAVIKTHMMSHEETKFPCTECDKSYKSLKWLQNHCKKSHGKQYKCDVCSDEFKDVAGLSSHSKIHTSEDHFKCETCGQRFDCNKLLKKHMKIHKTWKCRRCDIDFETREELKIHRDQHKTPFRCVACDFASKTASELKQHMKGHDDIDEFICKICDKTFVTATALYNHQLTHINLKKFTCEYCGSGFTHRSTLIIHKRVHTGERPYPCTMCDKAFIEKSALRSHMISHSSERKHKCELCGKAFPHKCSLVRHQRIHNEEKPFQCEQCKKTFGQSTQLKRHKRTHTGEKPYKCEDCGLRFGYVETLRSHRRIHNDITIYCKLCDKSFSTTVHLKRHMKTHTGEVDFVCDVCGEGFIRKDYFMKHVKSHEKNSENVQASSIKS